MARECVEITIERLNIHLFVNDALGAVQQDRNVILVRDSNDFLHRVDNTQHVGNMGYRNQLDAALGLAQPLVQ